MSQFKKHLDESIDPEHIAQAMHYAFEDLEYEMKNVRNLEDWAEKYPRGAESIIKQMEQLTKNFSKIR